MSKANGFLLLGAMGGQIPQEEDGDGEALTSISGMSTPVLLTPLCVCVYMHKHTQVHTGTPHVID